MCEHLQPLENYLKAQKIPETFRGQRRHHGLASKSFFTTKTHHKAISVRHFIPC